VEWSTTPQRRRSSFSSTHTRQDMPEACPYNNGVGTRRSRVRSLPDRSPAQHTTTEASRLTRRNPRAVTHAGQQAMPEACPYNNYFDNDTFPLRVLRASSWTRRRRTGVRRNSLHWGVTAHAVTHTEFDVCSCCYFLWKKVTKELCGIGTHASIATPRAIGFGARGVDKAEKPPAVCTET
jgi:hypothetical protein